MAEVLKNINYSLNATWFICHTKADQTESAVIMSNQKKWKNSQHLTRKCQTFICNCNVKCHVPVEEHSLPGWTIGRQVALCRPCNITNKPPLEPTTTGASFLNEMRFPWLSYLSLGMESKTGWTTGNETRVLERSWPLCHINKCVTEE